MALLLRFLLLTLAALLLGGCSALMPRSHTVTNDTIPWKSYSDARAFFDKIVVNETKLEDLKGLGIDTQYVEFLAVPRLTAILHGNPTVPFTSLPSRLQMCLSHQDSCLGLDIFKRVIDKDAVGSFALRVTRFVEENEITGWHAKILLVAHNGVIIYKHFEGASSVTQHEKQINPLGPLQGVNPISIGR
ncbi:MAG TPA: hypothetical protein VLB83_01755 [Candidatus Paceibacterota bacterium]|nr:hypothetical protein [Candidatus Paceibacterota bacterium]